MSTAEVKGEPVNRPDEPAADYTDPRFFHPVEEAKIVEWRTLCFQNMGFNLVKANKLAVRRDVEHHAVARMVEQGCDLKLAMKIVL